MVTSCNCVNRTVNWDSQLSLEGGCQEITFTRAPFSAVRRNATACVDPTTFGQTCGSHWTQVFENTTSNSDWYNARWCFVDPLDCYGFNTFDAHILNDDSNLALSYEACGNLGSYESRFEHLRGETVRIAYPPLKRDDIYVSTNAADRDGVAIRFFNKIFFEPYELNVVEYNVSWESLDRYISPFTACAHDVAIGRIDVCPTPMYRTADRLIFVDFTMVFDSVKILLVVDTSLRSNETSGSFWQWAWTPLDPFSWRAWVAILLVCLYVELAKRVIHKVLEGKHLKNVAKDIGVASFDAVVSITAGGEVFIPDKTSAGEKIMISGFAIFAWIFMSAYTASFTFSLISNAEVDSLDSLKDLVKQGEKVCMVEATQEHLVEKYSFLSDDDLVLFKTYDDVVDGLMASKCRGGILADSAFDKAMLVNEEFCLTKEQVGDTLLEIPKATPTNEKFADLLNYQLLDAINSGVFQEIWDEYKEEFLGSPICEQTDDDDAAQRRLMPSGRRIMTGTGAASSSPSTSQKTVDGDDSSGSSMGISHMILPLLTTFVCTTLGLITFLHSKYRQKLLDNLDKNILSHDDHSRWQEKEIKAEISRMSNSELIKLLWDNSKQDDNNGEGCCSRQGVKEAMNKLPDRVALERLVFQYRKENRVFREKFSAVQSLTTAEVYRVLIANRDDDDVVVDEANEALGSLRPKKELVDIAMRESALVVPLENVGERKSGKFRWKGSMFKGSDVSHVETGLTLTDHSKEELQERRN